MLTLTDITVHRHGVNLIANITASLYPGDFIVVLGHNGSGKSTLLEVLGGSLSATGGILTLDQCDITGTTINERTPWLGFLHQQTNRGVVNTLTVAENIALAGLKNKAVTLCSAMTDTKPLIERYCALVGTTALLDKKAGALSGGQRQVLAFFIATHSEPRLLLCDEPVAALDPVASEQMMMRINAFAQHPKRMTIIVTHELEDAVRYGTVIWIMKEGKLVHQIGAEAKKALTYETLRQLL